jgi:hypothetical protein
MIQKYTLLPILVVTSMLFSSLQAVAVSESMMLFRFQWN